MRELRRRIVARRVSLYASSVTSMTFSSEASVGIASAAFLAPFRMDLTFSGDISDAPSLTLAEAVMLVGRPDTVINLSKSIPTA